MESKLGLFCLCSGIVADVCLFFDHLNVYGSKKDSSADIFGLYVDRLAHTFLFTVSLKFIAI